MTRPAFPSKKSLEEIDRTIRGLSLPDRIGQTIFPAVPAVYPPAPGLLQKLQDLGVGGMLLREGGLLDGLSLIRAVQDGAGVPLIVCADMERGVGERLRGATAFPANMAFGASPDRDWISAQAEVVAREARFVGIDLLLAPVLDIEGPARCSIVGTRAYSDDPRIVARLGAAYIDHLRTYVGVCGKHFPGHGAASGDSHEGLPLVDRPRLDLMAFELVPFRRAIEFGVDAIMLGHLRVPAICGEGGPPASLSEVMIRGVLREELGFEGLVMTDAILMGGATDIASEGAVAVAALRAGADVLLCPTEAREIHASVEAAVEDGTLPEERLDDAVRRVLAFKESRALLGAIRSRQEDAFVRALKRRPDPGTGGVEEDGSAATREEVLEVFSQGRRVALRMAESSIALLKNDGDVLPWRSGGRVLIVHAPDRADPFAGTPFIDIVSRAAPTEVFQLLPPVRPADLERLARRMEGVELLLWAAVGRAAAWRHDERPDLDLGRLRPKASVFVALGSPVLLDGVRGADAWVCSFSDAEVSQEAAARAVLGEIPFRGRLPITCEAGERGFGLTVPGDDEEGEP